MYVAPIANVPPRNGNPGIVPPWLRDGWFVLPVPGPVVPPMRTEVIGITPVDPNTPVIM